jgi:integrase
MRQKLTPAFVRDAVLPENGDRVIYWDTTMPSFGLMVTAKNARSFVCDYRNADGVKRRKSWPARTERKRAGLTIDEAKREAKKLVGDVERGADPVEEHREQRRKVKDERQKQEAATTTTLKAICEEYLTREGGMARDVEGNATFAEDRELRSAPERLAVFERLVYPDDIADHQIEDVQRSEITKLLDKVEDERGKQSAQQLLAFLSRVFTWYAARHNDFRSPIVRGMGRVKPRERAGKRKLTDEEIRDLWAALDAGANNLPSCYPAYVRALLLTALRRKECSHGSWSEIATMHRDNIDGYTGDVWTIPAHRMKNKHDHAVPLTSAVMALIGGKPKDAKARPYLFSTVGGITPFSGYSKAKKALNEQIAIMRQEDGRDPMPPWKLHDLRRTAKTLMARAGVRPDISERVLSHVIPGVEGVYDCYSYLAEKRDALDSLAALVDRIVNPRDNVLQKPTSQLSTAGIGDASRSIPGGSAVA